MSISRSLSLLLAVAVLSAAAGAALWDRHRPGPAQTTLMLATCGLVPAPEPMDLPLARLMAQAGGPGLVLGPILHPGLDTPLSIRFTPVEPGAPPPPPHRDNDTLVLPVVRDSPPDAIRLACRNNRVAEVRYRHGSEWTRTPVAASGPEPGSEPDPESPPASGASSSPAAAPDPTGTPDANARTDPDTDTGTGRGRGTGRDTGPMPEADTGHGLHDDTGTTLRPARPSDPASAPPQAPLPAAADRVPARPAPSAVPLSSAAPPMPPRAADPRPGAAGMGAAPAPVSVTEARDAEAARDAAALSPRDADHPPASP